MRKSQAQRYQGLVDSNAVSQQDTETFTNQATATASAVKSAQANVERLKELQSFEKIYAPFDGVITARSIDTGQLIDTGAAKELFHMQALNTLRVYTNVPQIYYDQHEARIEDRHHFSGISGQDISGDAGANRGCDRSGEPNIAGGNRRGQSQGRVAAGVAGTGSFQGAVRCRRSSFRCRRSSFAAKERRWARSDSDNIAHLVPVTIGQDDGATVQIVSGLKEGDRVIQDPPDSLIEGEKVSPQTPSSHGTDGQPEPGGK